MAFGVSFGIAGLALSNMVIHKKILSVSSIYLLFWSFAVCCDGINFIQADYVEPRTYLIIFIGCLGFWLGNILLFSKKLFMKKGVRFFSSEIPNYTILMVLAVVYLMGGLWFLSKTIRFIYMGYPFSQLRGIFQGYVRNVTYRETDLDNFLINYVEMPLHVILPLLAIADVAKKENHKLFYFITILGEILYFVFTQSRFGLVYIMVAGIFVYVRYQHNLPVKVVKMIRRLISLLFIMVVLTTVHRFIKNPSMTLYQTWWAYLCGGIHLLDGGIKMVDDKNFLSYGANYIYGFLFYLESILKIGGIDYSEIYLKLTEWHVMKEWLMVNIGNKITYCAFYTAFFDFYLDFKEAGVLLGGILLGRLCKKTLNSQMNDNATIREIVIGLLSLIILVMSIVRWQFTYSPFCMSYFYLFLVFFNNKHKIKLCKNRFVKES